MVSSAGPATFSSDEARAYAVESASYILDELRR